MLSKLLETELLGPTIFSHLLITLNKNLSQISTSKGLWINYRLNDFTILQETSLATINPCNHKLSIKDLISEVIEIPNTGSQLNYMQLCTKLWTLEPFMSLYNFNMFIDFNASHGSDVDVYIVKKDKQLLEDIIQDQSDLENRLTLLDTCFPTINRETQQKFMARLRSTNTTSE